MAGAPEPRRICRNAGPPRLPLPVIPPRLVLSPADITGALGIGSTITGNIQGALKGLTAKNKELAEAAAEQFKTDFAALKKINDDKTRINGIRKTSPADARVIINKAIEETGAGPAAKEYIEKLLDGSGSLDKFEKSQQKAIQGMQQSTRGAKVAAAGMQMLQVAASGLVGTLASIGISLAVNALFNLFTQHGPTMEEMIQDTQALREEYDSLTEQIGSLQTGLDDVNGRIKELEAIQSPTLVQQEELDKLRETSAEYEKQIALLEAQAKYKNQEANDSAHEVFERQRTETFFNSAELAMLQTAVTQTDASEEYKKMLNSKQGGMSRSELLDIAGEALEALEPESRAYQDLVERILEIQTQSGELADAIVAVDAQSRADKEALTLLQDRAGYLLNADAMLEPLLNSVLSKDSLQGVREELEELSKAGKLDADAINRYTALTAELERLGITSQDAARGINRIMEEEDRAAVTNMTESVQNSVAQIKSSLNELQSALATLDSAIDQNNAGGVFSTSENINLITLYPQLADKIVQTAGGFQFEAGALEEVRRVQLQTARERIQAEIAQTKSTIQNCQSRIAAYSAEIRARTTVNSVDQAISAEKKNISNHAFSLLNPKNTLGSMFSIIQSGVKISQYNQYKNALAEYEENQKILDDAEAQLNALDKSLSLLETSTESYTGAVKGGTSAIDRQTAAVNRQKEALESQKQALQDQREELQKQRDAMQKTQQQMQDDQSAINSLLDLTMNMLRKKYETEQEYEQEAIDKLEEKYDAIKKTYDAENEAIQESISLKKEALEQQRDEREYQKELEERRANILELETQLNTLRLDNSASAQKHALELEEELAGAKQELDDFLYDHETQAQLEALEKQSEETDNYYEKLAEKADLELEHEKEIHNAKLEQLAEYLEGDVNLRNEAIALINARTDAFYQSLLDYNRKYGSGVDAEVRQKWNECYDALGRYNSGQLNTLSTLNKLVESAGLFKAKIAGLDGQISGLDGQISNVDKQIGNVQNHLSDLNSQIGNVSSSLGNLHSTTAAELKARQKFKKKDLEILQERWQNELWILSNSEKEDMLNEINRTKQEINYLDSLIKQYSYHTGGIVGDNHFDSVGTHNVTSAMRGLIASLDSDEVVAKLQVGEAVLTQRQQQNLFRLLSSRNTASLTFPSGGGSSVVMGDIIVQGSADKTTVQAIRKVQEETVEMVFNKMNKLRRKAGINQYAVDIY